jgi:small conductance mechanosensitive channel
MLDILPSLGKIDFLALYRAAFQCAIGLFLAIALRAILRRCLPKHTSVHHVRILLRFVYYGVLLIFFIAALNQLGFDMTALIGVTGIATMAIGFASQTAASNVISGLFMLGEKPFQMGDRIEINGYVGDVLAMGFLSVTLRKLDDTMVRIPNEHLIKAIIINHSRFGVIRLC